MSKYLRFLIELFSWLLITTFVVIMVLTLISNFNFLRGYRSYLVQSGSMAPSVMIGDVVITAQGREYSSGEVVTFLDRDERTVTHRIIATEGNQATPILITKGDANQAKDRDQIVPDRVLGKVILVIPKLGFLIAFSRTIPGLLLLVVIPALIIVYDEIKNFSKYKKTSERLL